MEEYEIILLTGDQIMSQCDQSGSNAMDAIENSFRNGALFLPMGFSGKVTARNMAGIIFEVGIGRD